jgi:hypothetical protein
MTTGGGQKVYAGGAVPANLLANIGPTDTSFQLSTVSGWPNTQSGTVPFVVTIDRGTSSEERIECINYTGSASPYTVTVNTSGRGFDGTSAQSHSAGTGNVECTLDAASVQDFNDHAYVTTRDDHSQYLNVARHDITGRHVFGSALGSPATPATLAVGGTGAVGTGGGPPHSDHNHPVPTGTPGASAPGDTAGAGTSTSFPALDHKHGREPWGTAADITTSAVGDAAGAGATGHTADAGHRHGRESYATLINNVTGSGTAFPASPQTGQFFYRTDLNQTFVWTGSIWGLAGYQGLILETGTAGNLTGSYTTGQAVFLTDCKLLSIYTGSAWVTNGLLAYGSYTPGSSYLLPANTATAIDSTNLITASFTVPPSGKLLTTWGAAVDVNTSAGETNAFLTLMNASGTVIGDSKPVVECSQSQGGSGPNIFSEVWVTPTWYLSGLTPGASMQIKLAGFYTGTSLGQGHVEAETIVWTVNAL